MSLEINIIDVLYGKYSFRKDNGLIFEIDDGFSEITGYTQKDIENGLSMLDLVPKEDLKNYISITEKKLSKKPECYLEHRIVKKNGECMYVLCYGHNIYSASQNCDVGKILIADVTKMVEFESIFKNVKEMFYTIIDNVPSGIVIYELQSDNSFQPILANKFSWSILGFNSRKEFADNFDISKMLSPDDFQDLCSKLKKLCTFEIKQFKNEYKIITQNGDYVWIDFNFKISKNEDSTTRIYMVMSDVTELKNQMYTIDYQNKKYELIQELTNELYFEYDLSTDTITLPKNIDTIHTGKGKPNNISNFFIGGAVNRLLEPKYIDMFHRTWKEAIQTGKSGSLEFKMKIFSHDISYQWYKADYIVTKDNHGNNNGFFGKIIDINENHKLRKQIQKNKIVIDKLSSIDAVTGLLNKTTFCSRFDEIIKTLDLNGMSCAMISADINDFSYVNDNFSYDAGNKMLIEYSNLLLEQSFYILNCRIYSDFFYCLAYSNMSNDDLINAINKSNSIFNIKQKYLYPAGDIRICAGIYFIESNDIPSTICMDNCDLARRSIKNDKLNNNQLAIYNEDMRNKRSREKAVASELNEALSNNKIEVFLQPKFNMKTFKIIGAEALSRWRNDDGSLKPPYTFIPVLENLGYIVQLDFYVYEQVLKIMRSWIDNNVPLMPISVNFSRVHTRYENFVDKVIELADKYQIEKSFIEIEITESAFAHDSKILIENMKRLRKAGFKIDIDDFGIGYSSLGILLDTPVDVIKIDKKFIDDINNSSPKQDFLKQLCILINTTNKNIIFEGVELKEQSRFLCDCGFYMAQGWLFDKAIPINEFESKYIYTKD